MQTYFPHLLATAAAHPPAAPPLSKTPATTPSPATSWNGSKRSRCGAVAKLTKSSRLGKFYRGRLDFPSLEDLESLLRDGK
ncbi:MAG: hypothetical protein EPO28_15375 [Saprospiraceae bacterium]|nr:MAG: hypothetical protein EPO28_15375 [Saprospiraceae bacterium]